MKIIAAGLPPAQSRAIEREFPQHDVLTLGPLESVQRYLSHASSCDLCCINVRLMSHEKMHALRKFRQRMLFANGYSSMVAAIKGVLGELQSQTSVR